jgi:aspartyl-tRNA(Asn)/glutamyl-tRNA(Gln) amidotransferase subunit A
VSFDSLAASLKSGQTAVSLVAEALEKAAAAPAVFLALRGDAALAEAAEADARRKDGKPLGPLDGIPIAWKDLFDIAGMRTTAGSLTLADGPPAKADAAVVAATRSVGLIPLGKTNLTEFAFSGIGFNPHFGTPFAGRPGGEGRIPGGSSSGSAVAVERGIVPAAMCTDTAGSVRLPAAFTGLVGYKASRGRYPMTGVFPLSESFDSLGPVARSVADCIWVDAALRGVIHPGIEPARPAGIVVEATLIDDSAVEEIVRQNLASFVENLRSLGLQVEVRAVEAFGAARRALKTYGWLGAHEAYQFHRKRLETDAGRIDPRVANRLLAAATFPPENVTALTELRPRLVADMAHELDGRLLLTPTVPHVAPLLAPLEADFELFAKVNMATLSLTMPGSYLDTPGVAMPSGADAFGNPTSVLLSSASRTDEALLTQTLWIERALAL